MTEEQATQAQIKALQKLKLHAEPWTLSKKEAWTIMDEHFKDKEKFDKNLEKYNEAPVVRPGNVEKTQPDKPMKEFHLSPEQVNTNALNAAIECIPSGERQQGEVLIAVAKKFKEFIENGN